MEDKASDSAMDIMLALALGPARVHDIVRHFYLGDGQDLRSRLEYGRRKIRQMEKAGYVICRQYKSFPHLIAVLTEWGAEKLEASVDSFDPAIAWTHIPREGCAENALVAGEIARRLDRDFTCAEGVIHFEPFLRAEARLAGKKGIFFPDFRLTLGGKNGDPEKKSYNFQVVTTGIAKNTFRERIRNSVHHILFVCSRAETMTFLYGEALKLRRGLQLSNEDMWKTHFAARADFFGKDLEKDFRQCEWLTPPYGKRYTMDEF
jgi:hypothetical protein